MRDDMYKVIVERPRKGGLYDGARQFRNDEARGGKIGMKQGYTSRKWLNENLAPLKRWLASQVNRPWRKVYAELCANIDRRNTVQEHIFAHIDGFVERNAKLVDGEVYIHDGWKMNLIPLAGSRVELYVHPRTGILLRNRQYVSWNRQRAQQEAAKSKASVEERRVVSDRLHLHKLHGVWYAVTLEKRPEPEEVKFPNGQSEWKITKVWDVLARKSVAYEIKRWHSPAELVYAKHKRQLSGAELRQFKLKNDNAKDTTPGKPGVFLSGLRIFAKLFLALGFLALNTIHMLMK
jgi:hypothetical protein